MESRITEQEIRDLVHTFYGRVRDDALLGPVFEARLAGRWGPHLDKMCDFWSSVMLATGRFHGNPVVAHATIPGIAPAHFDRWIELWHETAHEVLRPHLAADIVGRAERMRLVLERAACPVASG
ncbi:MAG TPA: group III truncated hemoglobin [Longimicrobiales bacterium]|nr:group III truncated hemoglobin [Longimicrobiales bacterium]